MGLKASDIGLSDFDLNGLITIFSRNRTIDEVILFGSRAKGVFQNGSDIDLAIKGCEFALNDMLNLSIEIDALELPYKIDLIILDRITEVALLEHIQRVGISLYKKEV